MRINKRMKTITLLLATAALGLLTFTAIAQNPPRPNTFMIKSIQAGSTTDIGNLQVVDLDTGTTVYMNSFSSASDATNQLNLFYWPVGGSDTTDYVVNGPMTRVVNGKLRLETTGFNQNGSGGYESHSEAEFAGTLPRNFLVTFNAIRLQWPGTFEFFLFRRQPTDGFCTYAVGGPFSTNRLPALRLDVADLAASGSWFEPSRYCTNYAFPNGQSPLQFPAPSANLMTTHQLGMSLSNNVLGFYLDGALLNSGDISQWVASPPVQPHTATGTAALVSGFVVNVSITDGGYGYTNTPLVRFIGGGGSGAQAVAVVSNGVVTAINVLNAGYGYTNAPVVVIEPPFIPSPVLGIAPMSFLSFSNLTVGGVYQLQQSVAWYWSNQPVSFTATSTTHTQIVAGVASSGDYRLALSPVPAQAFATAEVYYGFVVNATMTSGGSGYVTSPAIAIVGGGGSNATAVASISGGAVSSINITSAGIGYTNTPTIEIAQPPAAAVSPTAVLPVMRVDSANLAPYDNYQIQFKPALGEAWGNWNGGLLSPTGVTNSQYLLVTNGTGFFRLQYVP